MLAVIVYLYPQFLSYSSAAKASSTKDKPVLRGFLLDGEFFVGSALGTVLVKLALNYAKLAADERKKNSFASEAIFIMTSIIHLGKSGEEVFVNFVVGFLLRFCAYVR